MEARLQRVEGDVMDIRQDVQAVRANVSEIKQVVAVLDERQSRFHEDMQNLTSALGDATNEVSKLNTWTQKRGAFVAGATLVIGTIASFVAGTIVIVKDWFSG